jgi:hypothetical protein
MLSGLNQLFQQMIKLQVRYLFVALMAALSFSAPAQSKSWEQYKESSILSSETFLSVQVGMPTEAMQPAIRNNMLNKGFGLSLSHVWNPGTWFHQRNNSPFRLGFDAGYTYYGRFKRDGIKTSYGIIHTMAALRLRPPRPMRFTPYLEITAGGNYYVSEIKEDLDFAGSTIYDPAIFGDVNSAAFCKGLAVGFSLGKMKEHFHFRFGYTRGSSVRYIVRNSVSGGGGYITYETGRAPVEYFAVQIGIGGIAVK